MLVGRLGINPSEAKKLTRDELDAVVKYGTERLKDDWKRTRWLAAVLVNVSGKTVKKQIKETDLLRFQDERKGNGFADFVKSIESGRRKE